MPKPFVYIAYMISMFYYAMRTTHHFVDVIRAKVCSCRALYVLWQQNSKMQNRSSGEGSPIGVCKLLLSLAYVVRCGSTVSTDTHPPSKAQPITTTPQPYVAPKKWAYFQFSIWGTAS